MAWFDDRSNTVAEAFVVLPASNKVVVSLGGIEHATGLTARSDHRRRRTTTTTTLEAAAGEGRKKGKRKRRRKKPPAVPAKDPVKVSREELLEIDDNDRDESEMMTKEDMALIGEVAKFEFQTDKEMAMGVIDDDPKAASNSGGGGSSSNAIPLPDIKEARKKKQMEEELARMEQEKEEQKVRIKRSDKEAFAKVRFARDWICLIRYECVILDLQPCVFSHTRCLLCFSFAVA